MKIGVFSGSFDPFTVAHMAIVEGVLERKIVDKVIIVPSVVTWHRAGKDRMFNESDTCHIINTIIGKSTYSDKIELDDFEYRLKTKYPEFIGNRRFAHTISDITFRYGLENDFYTILGTDSLWNIKDWWKYKTILELSKLIAVSGRDGVMLPYEIYDAEIISIDEKYAYVSASKIRKRFSNAEDYLNNLNETYCDNPQIVV